MRDSSILITVSLILKTRNSEKNSWLNKKMKNKKELKQLYNKMILKIKVRKELKKTQKIPKKGLKRVQKVLTQKD
jgi:hypothetical protein